MNLPPRLTGSLALLALVPVVAYLLVVGETVSTSIAGLNVILITGALFLLFGPSPGEAHGNGTGQ